MKCPYRVNEESVCKNGRTYNYKEFAECYGKQCPYFDIDNKVGWCRKITKEVGYCRYQEVH